MNAETKRCFAALLRKQRREQSAFLNRSARTGKQRTQTGKLAFGALYGAIALVLMASFASLSWPLAQLLLPGGWGTLYFLVLELLALLVSVLAGALSSYNRLFQAKDNDLLLALPIPPWMIFAVRLCGLYEMSLFYLLLVWVPAEAAYARFAPHPLGGILSAVPMALLLAGAASVLAALLGWAVALLVAKAGRHKALFTVAASLGFLALYFLGYQKSGALLNALLSSALWGGGEGLPQGGWLLLGRAACGDIPALLGLLISLAAVCTVLGKLLSGPYLRLMTTRTGGAASKMKAAPSRRVSVRRALLRRELLHLAGSPTYLLNCAMGSLGLVVLSVLALYKAGEIRLLAVQLLPPGLAGAAAAFAAALGAGTNCLTAPSVSLEGESLWRIRSLPVSPWQTLRAKLELHLAVTLPPALLCAGVLLAVVRAALPMALLGLLAVALFVVLSAAVGLVLGVLMPSFHWTSETAVIKQSPFCLLAMLLSWGAALALFAGTAALSHRMPPAVSLSLACLLLAGADALALRWLKTKGAARFETT